MPAEDTADKEKAGDITYMDKSLDKSVTAGESVPSIVTTDRESYKNKPDCCRCLKLPAALIKRIVIIFTCTVIAVSFTVPMIIYGVDADRRSGEDTMLINLDLDDCRNVTDVQVGRHACMQCDENACESS